MADGPEALIICGTPRTGSTLLCGLLKATGYMGAPDSFYRRQSRGDWVREWGLSGQSGEAGYLAAAIRAGRGGTDLFAMRLMRENLEELQAILDGLYLGLKSDAARFDNAFGRVRYVHLARQDKLAQAVSLVRAEQEGLWHKAPDGTEIERLAPAAEPVYDFARLRAAVGQMSAFDAAWQEWFAAEGIRPLQVSYEALAGDPAGVLAGICGDLGLPMPEIGRVVPDVAKLADALSRDWMERYRHEAGQG
ncbi:MAG: Stf0 sulfotransferase family protein [Rhodobacteraceae bacterium]|nr:Stf0 sulfotransferase family protein [Paracoccaceae bacterium]